MFQRKQGNSIYYVLNTNPYNQPFFFTGYKPNNVVDIQTSVDLAYQGGTIQWEVELQEHRAHSNYCEEVGERRHQHVAD